MCAEIDSAKDPKLPVPRTWPRHPISPCRSWKRAASDLRERVIKIIEYSLKQAPRSFSAK